MKIHPLKTLPQDRTEIEATADSTAWRLIRVGVIAGAILVFLLLLVAAG